MRTSLPRPTRRQWAATVAMGTLLLTTGALAAGCSSDGGTSADGPTPAAGASGVAATAPVDPAVAASADAALTGDTKAICDQATRTGTAFGQAFLADLKLQIDAANQGAQAKSQAEQKIAQDVQNYSYALADMAKLTTDKALKKALTQMSKQVIALKGDVTKINSDKMSALSGTLDQACGKS
jgi:hypothetical protein